MIDQNDDGIRDGISSEENSSTGNGKLQRIGPEGSGELAENTRPYLKLRSKFPEVEASLAEDIACLVFLKPAFDCLLAIQKGDISEGNPYLLVLPDISDSNSMGYMHGGNYGLPPGAPGYIPWPGNYRELFYVLLLLNYAGYTSQGEHLLLLEHRCPLV